MKIKFLDKSRTIAAFYAINLHAFLLHKNMTQADLTRKFKCSRAFISDIANSKRPVPERIKTYLESL